VTYRVVLSDAARRKAKLLYPDGGSPDGRPSFELFERTILAAALLRFARGFDDLPTIDGLDSIRFVTTHQVPLFPATVFYGILGTDGVIEMIDFDPDEDSFTLLESDPDE
jgi:hypothetical protein